MGTIPNYPLADPLAGDELVALWQNGGQKSAPAGALAGLLQPFVDGILEAAVGPFLDALSKSQTALSANAYRFGVTGEDAQRFFTAGSTELAISSDRYRKAFTPLASISDVDGWTYARTGIASTTSAVGAITFFVENDPRISDQGLLVEGPGVNLFSWSEDFTQPTWVRSLVNVLSNVAPGPRGEGTMDKVVATGTGVHSVAQAVHGVSTVSVYAKAGELGWCAIEFADGIGFPIAYFDLVNGVVGTVSPEVTARIERAARGTWRISATVATTDAGCAIYAATGDGGASFDASVGAYVNAGFYVDMAQAEPNARPYSYVPAGDVSSTRGADRPSITFSPQGSFTLFVEAALPPPRATDDALLSLAGDDPTNRVAIYRNSANAICVQIGDADGLKVAAGPTYADPRTVRVALSMTATEARASFDGGEIVSLAADCPEGLNKLWIGLIADTLGFELNGFVRTVLTFTSATEDDALQRMSKGGYTLQSDAQPADTIAQALAIHKNDMTAHGLGVARAQMTLTESKTGMWSVRAADTFTGADGPLTAAESGGQAWIAVGAGQPLSRAGGLCKSSDGTLRGTYLAAGVADGQVEGDLVPGTGEASLYFRWRENGNYLMLQRGFDGSIGLTCFVDGTATNIAPVRYVAIESGERFKVRFVGQHIWVLRSVAGVETVIFDVIEAQWQTETSHGIRINGTGSVDNFRVLNREAI